MRRLRSRTDGRTRCYLRSGEQVPRPSRQALRRKKKRVLTGRRVLVTAGPTREAIDPVRYITNHSSGRMGYAIAAAAADLGAETVLITGPTALTPPSGIRTVHIESTAQLHEAVHSEFASCDCLIMAAAPSDYRPIRPSTHKLKRSDGLTLSLEPTADILKALALSKRPDQVVVGFALETDDGIANAERKLREKHLDLIVLNIPGVDSGFSTKTNRVTVIAQGGAPDEWPLLDKNEVALRLMELVAARLDDVKR